MEVVLVDSLSTIFPQVIKIEKIGHDIMPKVSVSTPIGSIEADYGSPILDGTVIVLVLGGLYIVKKILDRIKSNEP